MRNVIFDWYSSRDSPPMTLDIDFMTNILLVENVHPVAKERLESEGYKVDLISHAPSEAEAYSAFRQVSSSRSSIN